MNPEDQGGYKRASLHVNGSRKKYMVHWLVAKAFVAGFSESLIVNHKDGNKGNNVASNLEWVTYGDNTRHAWRSGLCSPHKGEGHGNAKLRNKDILAMRAIYATGKESINSIGRLFGTSGTNASYIVKRKAWRHI